MTKEEAWELLRKDGSPEAFLSVWDAAYKAGALASEGLISDGFGSYWSKTCPQCCQDTMEVVRPGKCQCSECG